MTAFLRKARVVRRNRGLTLVDRVVAFEKVSLVRKESYLVTLFSFEVSELLTSNLQMGCTEKLDHARIEGFLCVLSFDLNFAFNIVLEEDLLDI